MEIKNDTSKRDTTLKEEKSLTAVAHKEADKDIEQDPDLNDKPAPEDGLDEGELARLEGEE